MSNMYFEKYDMNRKYFKRRKNDFVRNIYTNMKICQIFISKNMT